jgi:hypothetical protein
MKNFKYIFLLIVITSCNAPQAVYDYDQQVQFNSLRTFQIYPELNSNLSQLDEKRIQTILALEMSKKGLSQTSEDSDVYLNYYTSSYETPSRSNIGIGVGGTGRNVGVGVSGGIPIGGPDTHLRITFDLISVKNDALIWQAVVDSPFDVNASPEKREEQFRVIVSKALEGYPPKKK